MASYAGVSVSSLGAIPVVNMRDMDAPTFFARFVATRTPCVLNGHPTDASWRASGWGLGRLAELAGDVSVAVEQRRAPRKEEASALARLQPFGRGHRKQVPLRTVLDHIASGGEERASTPCLAQPKPRRKRTT